MNNMEMIIELNVVELQRVNGGHVPMTFYLNDDTIRHNGDNICTFAGFFCGFIQGLVGF